MRGLLRRYEPSIALALILLVTLAGSYVVSAQIRLPERDGFNVIDWELRNAPNKWLYLTQRFFQGELSRAEEGERLARFLMVTGEISRLERGGGAHPDALERLRREQRALENDVEAIIEGRLTSVLESEGLETSLLGVRDVFPPVDTEFDEPLRVLTVSPRDRIERVEGRPLRLGLTLDEAAAIEQEVERDGRLSAIVDAVGGAATYPSIVAPSSSYRELVAAVAHEWVHHYLAFKPLGQRYFHSAELRTLNETVANLTGEALADLVVARYPLAEDGTRPSDDEDGAARQAYADAALRRLRLDVEELLSEGDVTAAEVLMEQRRLELAALGVAYRRINQAFFAARGFYADSAASIDPIGPKLAALLAREGTAGAFLRAASRLTSEAELDALLAAPRD